MLLELRSKKFTVSNLRCSEIDQLEMPFLIKHEILRLEVPMGDAIGMEILQYIDNLGDIEDLYLISELIDI